MAIGIPNAFYSLIERIRTSSVLAPLLVLTFIVGLFALAISWSSNATIINGLWSLFAICVIFTLIAYIGWSIKEPERLQTEDYRLARHRIDVIGDERNPNDAKVIEATPAANTHLKLPHAEVTK